MKPTKPINISASTLKIIALITMLIDHIGAVLLEKGLLPFISSAVLAGTSLNYLETDYKTWYYINFFLRFIGRISFPIYCFLLVEGFLHTKNVKNYALRLALFALISEIPFDLAFYGQLWNLGMQNVFFTLFIGLCTLIGMKSLESLPKNQVPFRLLVAFTGMILAEFLQTDYSAFGVLLIVLLYQFRNNLKQQSIIGAISTLWEYTAPLAFVLTYQYNGERGKQLPKFFFYSFYPLHLLLLVLIRYFIY